MSDGPLGGVLGGATGWVLLEVLLERRRQNSKWGEQNPPNGTGLDADKDLADAYRKLCDSRFAQGKGAWRDILMEEVAEAFAEADPERLREELIQVAAVAVAWIEAVDRRKRLEACTCN